jgi:hypothetical protein
MPVFILQKSDLSTAVVPPVLHDYLSFNTWHVICQKLNKVETQAHGFVFMMECIICVIFLFPCIFLCHPCTFQLLESGMKERYLRICVHRADRTDSLCSCVCFLVQSIN